MFGEYFIIILLSGILGAIFGSFINVVAIRTHEDSSLLGRSQCPVCKKKLKPRHLIPILSWLIQKGRCAYCGRKISIQYPLVEFGAFVLGVVASSRFLLGLDLNLVIFEFALMMVLLIFVVMDLRWMELPLELMVGTGIVFTLWYMLLEVSWGMSISEVAWSHLIGFSVLTMFFLLQWFVSRGRWIGVGDIWLGAVLGAILGWPLVGLSLYFSYIIGGGVALFLLLLKKIKTGTRVPFAPALIAGAIISLWWGNIILSWLNYALE